MPRSISRLVRWLLLLAISLVFAAARGGTNSAHAASAALFMQLGDDFGGDIFSYSGASLKNLTGYGYNGVPILSPDGKTIAYSSYAKTYVQDQFGGNGRSGPPAINIWVMDVATGSAKRLADQPADNRAQGEGRVRPFITRSDPRWSPDSKFLAWMEQAEGTSDSEDDGNDHLVLGRLSDGQLQKIFKQSPGGIGSAPPVDWNDQGISVIYTGDVQSPSTLRILDKTGKIRSETELQGDPPVPVQWLNGEKSPTIITSNELIELADDTHSETLPALEIYSLSAPDGLRFVSDAGYFDANWTLNVPGAEPLEIGKITDFAISPDGSMAAYTTDDGLSLYLFDGKKTAKVSTSAVKLNRANPVDQIRARGLAWSPLGIRIAVEQ
jgi:WD40-like Beta Propeller Repeat